MAKPGSFAVQKLKTTNGINYSSNLAASFMAQMSEVRFCMPQNQKYIRRYMEKYPCCSVSEASCPFPKARP